MWSLLSFVETDCFSDLLQAFSWPFLGNFQKYSGLAQDLCPVGPEPWSSPRFLCHTLGELSVFSVLSYHCAEDTIRVRTDPAPNLEEVIHRPLCTINLHSNWLHVWLVFLFLSPPSFLCLISCSQRFRVKTLSLCICLDMCVCIW